MRWGYISVAMLAACYEQPAVESCAVACEAECPDDLTCKHGLCVAPGEQCEPKLTSVRAGSGFACALDAEQLLWCWGSNANHQIDPSDAETFPRARQVGARRWDAISTGGGHVCGLREGRLYCWGNNDRGQVSDAIAGDVSEPLEISVGAPWTFVDAGYNATCGIAAGSLYCWGAGDQGQLGTGDTFDVGVPTRVSMLTDWTEVSTNHGRYGGTDAAEAGGGTPGSVYAHTCGISTSMGVLCWGIGSDGELGHGMYANSLVPVQALLPADKKPVHIEVGLYSTYMITDTQELYSWGYGGNNALGDPQVVMPAAIGYFTNTPILATTLQGWTSVSSAEEFACALRDGDVWCWGYSRGGGLANGVWGSTGFARVATGASDLSVGWNANIDENGYDRSDLDLGCMLVDGQAACWGDNRYGQLGQGGQVMHAKPTKVAGDHTFSTLAAGAAHVCGIENGRPLCWGSTLRGEATGTAIGGASRPCMPGDACAIGAPSQLPFMSAVDDLFLGTGGGCARAGSAVTCWGDNTKLQLGAASATSPATVPGTWEKLLETGSHGQCGLQNGETWCWGSVLNTGSGPVREPALDGLASFVMSGPYDDGTRGPSILVRSFGCGLDATNRIRCVGDNVRGQFGNGAYTGGVCNLNAICDNGETSSFCSNDCGAGPLTTMSRTYQSLSVAQPTLRYDGIVNYNATAYSCGITGDGGVECWGRNYRGQVGVDPGGSPYVVALPNRVPGLTSCTAVSASDYHACAICSDDVYCWGDHRYGAVGAGPTTTVAVTVPRKVDVVLGSDRWVQLVSGAGFTCGRTQNGVAYCWGFAPHGALGDGATSSSLPVTITLDY